MRARGAGARARARGAGAAGAAAPAKKPKGAEEAGNWRTGLFPGSGGPAAKREGRPATERPRNNKAGSARLVEAPPAPRKKAGEARGKAPATPAEGAAGKDGELELVLGPDGRVVPAAPSKKESSAFGLISSARAARAGNLAKPRESRQGPKSRAGTKRLKQAKPAPPAAPVEALRRASTSTVSGSTLPGTPGRTEAPVKSWWKSYGGGKGKPGKPASPKAGNNKAPLPVPVIAPISAGEKKRDAIKVSKAPNAKDGTAQSAALAGGAFLAYTLSGATGVGGVVLLASAALALRGSGDTVAPRTTSPKYGQSWKSKFWDGDSPTGAAAGKPAAGRPKNNKKGSSRLVQKAPPGAKKKAKATAAATEAGRRAPFRRAGKPAAERPQNNKILKKAGLSEKGRAEESDSEREARLAAVLDAVDADAADTTEARQRLEAALGDDATA